MPTEPVKVLVVCTGNICRSPVAERLLQARASQLGFDMVVSSAGTRALNGKPMHPESARVLEERGLDGAGFTSRLLTPSIAVKADVVLGLTREHRALARQLAPMRWRRMYTLREAAGLSMRCGINELSVLPLESADEALDIDDPMGKSALVFDRISAEIEATVDGVMASLEQDLLTRSTAVK